MSEPIGAVSTGIAAFTATNLDDIVILLLFFSQVNAVFRHGSYVMPFVLIGLGVMILVESHTLESCSYVALPLLVAACGWILLNRNSERRLSEVENR